MLQLYPQVADPGVADVYDHVDVADNASLSDDDGACYGRGFLARPEDTKRDIEVEGFGDDRKTQSLGGGVGDPQALVGAVEGIV